MKEGLSTEALHPYTNLLLLACAGSELMAMAVIGGSADPTHGVLL